MPESPSTSCIFRGFQVNPNMPLKEWDDIKQLGWAVVHKVTHWRLDTTEKTARAAIRYILSLNCCNQINFYHGDDQDIVALKRDGTIVGRWVTTFGNWRCLYLILNNWFTELAGCSPVRDFTFEGSSTRSSY